MVLSILCIYQSWGWNQSGVHMKDPWIPVVMWISSSGSPLRQIVQGTFRSLQPRCQPSTKVKWTQSNRCTYEAATNSKDGFVVGDLANHLLPMHVLEKETTLLMCRQNPETIWNLPSPLGSSHCSGVFVGFWIPEIPHLSTPKEVQALGEPEEWHRWPSRVNPRNTLQMANKGECSVPILDYQRLVGMQWRQWWYTWHLVAVQEQIRKNYAKQQKTHPWNTAMSCSKTW